MLEFQIDIQTPTGAIDTFICCPDEGGPHPVVIFYMDAPAIREELRDMARRIASCGYYVMLPNMFYRHARPEHYGFDHNLIRSDDAQRQIMLNLMNGLSNQMVIDDTAYWIAHARSDPRAKAGAIGCVGYCMSGRFVMSAAAAYPADFAAVASYYGVGIITDQADSPHLIAHKIRGEVYLAFAQQDIWVSDALLAQMPSMLSKAGVNGRVEIYPGTEHGFAFSQRTAYVRSAADRHWERMLALFSRNLK